MLRCLHEDLERILATAGKEGGAVSLARMRAAVAMPTHGRLANATTAVRHPDESSMPAHRPNWT